MIDTESLHGNIQHAARAQILSLDFSYAVRARDDGGGGVQKIPFVVGDGVESSPFLSPSLHCATLVIANTQSHNTHTDT